MTWQIKAAVAAVIAALAFSAGWVVKGWQSSKTIAELRAERAQGQATRADAAARSDLADKAAALDRQLAEGLGMVASLGGDLRRRDAEVAALCDQVNIERRLSGDDSDQACSAKAPDM